MATNPELPPSGRAVRGTSWSERLRLAREAEPPPVEVSAAVRAAIARERDGAAREGDGWSVFAGIFGRPRVWIPGAACTVAGAPCAVWVLTAQLGHLDGWVRFLVIGGLPRWLAAWVT